MYLGVVCFLLTGGMLSSLGILLTGIKSFEENEDIAISPATNEDFPAMAGYGNNLWFARAEIDADGEAKIVLTTINLTNREMNNLTIASVSAQEVISESTAPSIAIHNQTVYVCWAEKSSVRIVRVKGTEFMGNTTISGIAEYYHAPSIATFGSTVWVAFLCGNFSENARIVAIFVNASADVEIAQVDTLPMGALTPRKIDALYDIYGNVHFFISGRSSIEHYFRTNTTWNHESLSLLEEVSSEVNVKFVNDMVYLGFSCGKTTTNFTLASGKLTQNGSIQNMETVLLSSIHTLAYENIYFAWRTYIATSGTKTIYLAWSEVEGTNLTLKIGKMVSGELISISSVGRGKICGIFAEMEKIHLLVIKEAMLHYQMFSILRENVHLTVISTEPRSITLSWSRNYDEDFAGYEVHFAFISNYTPSPATLYANVYDPEHTEITVENLELGKEYFFLVVVRFADNTWIQSNFISYKTPEGVDAVEPWISDLDADGFTVNWTSVTCDHYEVHFSTNPEFQNETVIELGSTGTYFTFDSLNSATTYFVFVRTFGSYGDYNDSKLLPVLTKPRILNASADVDEVTLTWEAPGSLYFEKMEVYISTNQNMVFERESLATTVFTPTVSNLTFKLAEMCVEYYFGIVVYNTYWESEKSTIVSATTFLPAIPQVRIIKHEILNTTAVRILWSPVDYKYFSRLEIHISFDKKFTPSDHTIFQTIYTLGETSTEIYGLTPDVPYYVKLVLVDSFNQRSVSETLCIRTTSSIDIVQPAPEIPFYVYGILLLVFFITSIISAIFQEWKNNK
ncbi:MAG: fibronectin type III domain-containing protein [Thermoplasmata archaeon]